MTYKPLKEFIISNSALELFHSCERKFEFRRLYEGKRDDMSLPPAVGQAIHAGFQEFLLTRDLDKAIGKLILNYPAELNDDPLNNRSMEAAYATLVRMLESRVFTEYSFVQLKTPSGLKPAIEVHFRFRLKNTYLNAIALRQKREFTPIPIYYDGFVDAFMFNNLHDVYEVFDAKSHRRNLYDLTPCWMFDDQIIPYGIVLEHILGNKIEELTYNYLTGYVDLMNPKAQPLKFHKTSIDIKDWAKKLVITVRQLQEYYDQKWFPRRSSACTSWNRVCGHFEYCDSRDSNYLAKVMAMGKPEKEAVRKRWQPMITIDLELRR